jgi:hypothetical protein
MDAGVIKTLKLHCRIQLVRQRLAAHEEAVSFQFDMLDSMRLFASRLVHGTARNNRQLLKVSGT